MKIIILAIISLSVYSESYIKHCIGSDLKICMVDLVDTRDFRDVKCYLETNGKSNVINCSSYYLAKDMFDGK